MKNTKFVIIIVVCVCVILGGYYYLTNRNNAKEEENITLTEIQELTTKNLDKNYPATPREVVKLYNRIITCFYNDEYTDDEFYDASNPSNNGIASPVRLEWTISDEDYDVVKFVNPSSGGDAYLQTVSGTTNPTVYGNRAGAATITAAYHSKKFSDTGAVVYDNVLATSTAAVYVPINVNVERKRGNTVLEEADLLKEGDLLIWSCAS